ncbi:LCP family protein [Fusibacillus kribbianus]|uniref:LCP family protein n=1 Tax=Fusibacillus kribbianus TaxID=3044208 RepID=A0AAP4F0B2_9FIRM|nr:LCP family protein [Ruminococcus sp. YH-rum2234]MDI9241573.1 LCP family protein [Ruminococcus sp. YH-rum2234]
MENRNRESDVDMLNRELMEQIRAGSPEDSDIQGRKKSGSGGHGKYSKKRRRKLKRQQKKKKKIKPFQVFVIFLCVLLFLLAAVVAAFFVLRSRGEKLLRETREEETITAPEEAEVEEAGKVIIYKGEKYCYNEDIVSILCMGIDKSIRDTGLDNIGENGQADALFLAVLNTKTGQLSFVNISRDSMVDVNKYNVEGKYLGVENMQICLSYAYGDGKEKSCENTVASVSRLLYGMPVNAYAAIDYSGISVLNDAVGGVTVEVLEDLTGQDSELQVGKTVTLSGEQAHTYVRSRDTELLDSNNMRMARQKQYLMSFLGTTISKTKSDLTVPVALYQAASEYMVTDISVSEVTYLASLVLQGGFSEGNMYSVPGEVVKGEKYAEFIPDEEGLYELILDVFYEKVN